LLHVAKTLGKAVDTKDVARLSTATRQADLRQRARRFTV